MIKNTNFNSINKTNLMKIGQEHDVPFTYDDVMILSWMYKYEHSDWNNIDGAEIISKENGSFCAFRIEDMVKDLPLLVPYFNSRMTIPEVYFSKFLIAGIIELEFDDNEEDDELEDQVSILFRFNQNVLKKIVNKNAKDDFFCEY